MLARQCRCEHLLHFHIAEREAVGCNRPSAHEDCLRLLDLLRGNARFTLKLIEPPHVPLPHGKEIKVQVGGLRGVARVTAPGEPTYRIDNVFGLVEKATAIHGGMENLPYTEIVREIARYEGRPRRRR